MKKVLILLSAVLLIALMAIPAMAEFDLEDFTIPDTGVHFGFNGDAKDEFGNVTGELVGDPTFVEGRDGTANGAIYLDDNEQYVLIGKYVDADSYTAIFWCKVEDNTEHVFLCSSMLGSIRIIHDDATHVGSTINGVADNISDYAAPREEWVMMAFVYADENMDIYANGEYVASLGGALPLPFTLIGNEATEQKGWQSYPFLAIDDAWFYGRAFTADEVKNMYAETGGTASAPAAGGSSEPSLLWDFNEDELMSENMGANSNNAVSFWGEKDDAGNDYYLFVAGGNDPYVSVDLEAEDVSDVVWCKARVRNSGPATAIELFGHTDGRGLTGSECTHINLSTDGQWHTYIIYIPDENVKTVNAYKDPQYAITEPYWAGTVDWIRLDPMWQEGNDGSDSGGSMSSGDEIAIDYIAFFPTEEAAKAFRSELDSAAESSAEIVDSAVEVRSGYRFYSEQPDINGQLLVDVNSDLDEISGYNGEIGVNLHNLASGGNGYCCKMDSCVWYDFEAPSSGTYLFMIEYVARNGAERGVDWALDDPDGTARSYIDLVETDEHGYVVGTFNTSAGQHSFYVYAPSNMDDSTLKSCDVYWVYVYYIPDGLAAALQGAPAAETPAAPEGYPSSGESGNIMIGTVIGNETGWDGTVGSGAASAFDGDPATYFDPLGVADGYCGMEFNEPYILEKVVILSRYVDANWNERFEGAMIEGSNDGEDWVTLWTSEEQGTAPDYYIVTEFENNYGYTMFRYFNDYKHGDVAEVEFYGKPGKVDPPPQAEEPAAEEPKTEEPAAEPEPAAEEPTAETPTETPAETPTETPAEKPAETAKSGCGSMIGGGLIVLVTVLGSAWISKRR